MSGQVESVTVLRDANSSRDAPAQAADDANGSEVLGR
jgi:hypothetical protein